MTQNKKLIYAVVTIAILAVIALIAISSGRQPEAPVVEDPAASNSQTITGDPAPDNTPAESDAPTTSSDPDITDAPVSDAPAASNDPVASDDPVISEEPEPSNEPEMSDPPAVSTPPSQNPASGNQSETTDGPTPWDGSAETEPPVSEWTEPIPWSGAPEDAPKNGTVSESGNYVYLKYFFDTPGWVIAQYGEGTINNDPSIGTGEQVGSM